MYKKGQTLFKVVWRDGFPYIDTTKVISVSPKGNSYKLEVKRKQGCTWSESWEDALMEEYKHAIWIAYDLAFGVFGHKPSPYNHYTIDDCLIRIIKTRRLESKLRKHLRGR